MEIKMMQSSLEKQRTVNDNERAQLLSLVKTLEIRLAEQTQAAREERWTMQQATATLAARSLAFDREIEFAKINLEREREHIKVLKQTMLAEQEEMILKLTEEKLAIATEKSRLEVNAKLNQNFDSAKAKAEIETAIKIAKEAAELTDKERENLCKQQCEVEILKRSYMNRETKLSTKQLELEKLFKEADEKYREGERSLTEAKVLEHKYTDQLKDIQTQLASLATREKKLAEEKIIISKNRLSVHNQMNDAKKCSLCEAGNFKTSYSPEYRAPLGFVEHNAQWGTDAEILRFKYDLENDNEVSKEISVAENS
ncbi:twitchy [Carabus blaptoides fortunei]